MDLERYSAKMILVPWDMMCDRTDRRTGGQENRKDRRTERTGGQKGQENRKDKRTERTGEQEIQEIKKGQKKKTPKLTFRV